MYSELYELWKRELQSIELERLSPDFYSGIANYLRKLKEENRMLDKRTVKARLLKNEARNVKRMLHELMRVRYRKLTRKVAAGEKISSDILAIEEEKLVTGFLPLTEAYQNFSRNFPHGHALQMNIEGQHKKVVLRFLEDVPEIIGADMKPYGPFKIEDVASLPNENAKLLVKQGMAEKIEAD